MTAGATSGHRRVYADRPSFDVGSLTFACWVKWNSGAAAQRIAQRGLLTNNGEWGIGITGNGSRFFGIRKGGSNWLAAVGGGPTTGTWQHWIGTYDSVSGAVTLYIDNSSVAVAASGSSALVANAASISFFEVSDGSSHGNNTLAHSGGWGVVLTAEERAALFAGAHPLSIRPTALFLVDELDLSAVDLLGGVPTNTGANLADAAGPPQLKYISRAPRRGRRAPSVGGAQSPLLLRLHNERLFTGGFA